MVRLLCYSFAPPLTAEDWLGIAALCRLESPHPKPFGLSSAALRAAFQKTLIHLIGRRRRRRTYPRPPQWQLPKRRMGACVRTNVRDYKYESTRPNATIEFFEARTGANGEGCGVRLRLCRLNHSRQKLPTPSGVSCIHATRFSFLRACNLVLRFKRVTRRMRTSKS